MSACSLIILALAVKRAILRISAVTSSPLPAHGAPATALILGARVFSIALNRCAASQSTRGTGTSHAITPRGMAPNTAERIPSKWFRMTETYKAICGF